MFDEYVEHTTGPAAGAVPTLPSLQYEGFEPGPVLVDNPHPELDVSLMNPEEAARAAAASAPIFDLGRVQYTLPAPLISLVVSSDMLAMGLVSNTIVLIELSHSDQVIKIQIPRKPNEFTIHKLFLDPSGRHLIVTSLQGENWYLYKGWKKPKQLKTFKMVIESVAWNRPALLASTHQTSTREMLIGSNNGVIYEAVIDAEEDFFKSPDRSVKDVFSLPERHSITGIKFDHFPPTDPRRSLVLVTTPHRIYQFLGVPDRRSEDGSRVFSGLFAGYRETAPKILELPGETNHSELHTFTHNSDQALSLPDFMAWLTGPGVYHGALNFNSTTDDFIDGAQLLPYPTFDPSATEPEVPTSMVLTEFHFILLYKDRLAGVCNLDEKLTYEETLPLKANEEVRGMTADPVRKTFWVYTTQSLFELVATNEDRDVWKIYLEKGKFDVALKYAKTASQRDFVLSAQAAALFEKKKFFQAAQCYAQCSVTFEEVALKFLDAGERDALRSYLTSRLERTKKTDLTQRMLLATWLVEFYLSKCNDLDDLAVSEASEAENVQAERAMLEEDLRHFFETYKANLDKNTVYELIQGHGRPDMYLYFATTVGDYERVIEHWVLEEEWIKAIDVINRQLQHVPRNPLEPNQALRYLHNVVFEQHNTSPTIHNLVITFYASPSAFLNSPPPEDDGPLLRFLSSAPSDPLTGKPYYDLDYALRLCKQTGRTQPCVHIYSKMGLWENSVDLALAKGDLDLAKINADMPEDDVSLRKKLWLKIARYVVQDKNDIKTAMRFLEDTDLLKIEDILPFFPDFVVIDDFKEEIAHALEGYSAQIDVLKNEMDDATRTAEAIKQDIAALRNRFITISSGEQCSRCKHLLLTRQFYAFPCQHAFHADCLIEMAKEYLPTPALRRIIALQNELMKSVQNPLDRPNIANPSLVGASANGQQPPTSQQGRLPGREQLSQQQLTPQRTLLSANFTTSLVSNPLQNGTKAANSLGRNILNAGDKLRDLVIPDALASVVSAPGWIPGMGLGGGGNKRSALENEKSQKMEKLKAELDDVLAGSCPLCDSVVEGLDKPFIREGEVDDSWAL